MSEETTPPALRWPRCCAARAGTPRPAGADAMDTGSQVDAGADAGAANTIPPAAAEPPAEAQDIGGGEPDARQDRDSAPLEGGIAPDFLRRPAMAPAAIRHTPLAMAAAARTGAAARRRGGARRPRHAGRPRRLAPRSWPGCARSCAAPCRPGTSPRPTPCCSAKCGRCPGARACCRCRPASATTRAGRRHGRHCHCRCPMPTAASSGAPAAAARLPGRRARPRAAAGTGAERADRVPAARTSAATVAYAFEFR